MPFEKKPKYGALFANKDKQHDKHPSMKGYLVLEDGTEIEIAAWTKVGPSAGKFLSLKISDPKPQQEQEDETPF